MNAESQTSPKFDLPFKRAWNIALRTAHIGVACVLVGGHVFAEPSDLLFPWLVATAVTGGALGFVEAFPHIRWFYQGRGFLVLLKMALICAIPWVWAYRVPILFLVVIIASVGSHMPARFRYYSLLHRRVLD